MTIISRHGLNPEQFEEALVAALAVSRLTPRTAVIRAGGEVYERLLRSEEDGPHAVLGGVGFIGLVLDESMEPWTATVVEREQP